MNGKGLCCYVLIDLIGYNSSSLLCVTTNKTDTVTVNVKDSKGSIFILTVPKDTAEKMKNGE